jgi:hypothetical protein
VQLAAISPTRRVRLKYLGHMDATQSLLRYSEQSDVSQADPNQGRRRTDSGRLPPEEQDDLLPARGVLVSVVIGAGMWAILIGVGWLIFR